MARRVNKDKQEEFLKLCLSEKMDIVNDVIEGVGTEGVSKLGFSYSWVSDKLAQENVYYVSSLKKFIKVESGQTFSDEEVAILKEVAKGEIRDKAYFSDKEESDIRQFVGICSGDLSTRTITLDKDINDKWNAFTKNQRGIVVRDLISGALKEFMDKYQKGLEQ